MVKKLSKEAGVRLVLHDSHSRPLPDEYGIDLAPNTASSIAVQLVIKEKLWKQRFALSYSTHL